MLLRGSKIKKEFGIQQVLDLDKLEIWDGDRIGLVGANGSGKSTLLSILYGSLNADEGVIERNCEISMISQGGAEVLELKEFHQGNDEMSGSQDSVARQYMSRLQLKDSAIKSGGEKTRLAIAAAFSKRTPLLFADEPTTNLDVEGIELLEKMLYGYPGALVLISHDRELLNAACSTIWELEQGKVRVFHGNYTMWYEHRTRERAHSRLEYEQYQAEKKRLEKTVRQVKQEAENMRKPPRRMGSSEWMLYKGIASEQQKRVQNRGRAIESRMEHLEKKEKPEELPVITMSLGMSRPIKAKAAARISDLTVAYGENLVLDHVSLELLTGKRTFLVGNNGSGKTTLVRHLAEGGEHAFLTEGASIGYFSQEHETLDWNRTVLENVRKYSAYAQSLDRAVLANLYMSERDIHKKVSVLSGGERAKTALAQILVSACNVMILDEPTNHLDIYALEALEALLKQWKGTMLVITHDRKLVRNLAEIVVSRPV